MIDEIEKTDWRHQLRSNSATAYGMRHETRLGWKTIRQADIKLREWRCRHLFYIPFVPLEANRTARQQRRHQRHAGTTQQQQQQQHEDQSKQTTPVTTPSTEVGTYDTKSTNNKLCNTRHVTPLSLCHSSNAENKRSTSTCLSLHTRYRTGSLSGLWLSRNPGSATSW